MSDKPEYEAMYQFELNSRELGKQMGVDNVKAMRRDVSGMREYLRV